MLFPLFILAFASVSMPSPRRLEGVLPSPLLDLDSVRLAVMEPNGVFAGDLDLRPLSGKADRFRLSRVETVLRNPFRLEGVVEEVLARTEPYSGGGAAALPIPPEFLWPLLDAVPGNWAGELPGEPGSTDSALGRIRSGLADHVSGLSSEEAVFLFREASSLFLQEEEDTSLTAVQAELRRLKEDARAHKILELAGRLHRPGLIRASSAAWGLQVRILDSLRGPGSETFLKRLGGIAAKTGVPFKVGGMGADRHRPDRGIWIDLGGDDQYDLAPRGRPGEFLLIVDLGGNDLYRGQDSLHRSPGNMGVSMIADLAGNDHYIGSNYAFGSALFGYSSVFDAAGHDYYEGRCASLAFAAFGIGMIQDESGGDTYSASLMSEGASATMGLGLLIDRAGNDRYLARPTFQDDLRYTDHYINMVQGFSTGLAPDYSGGVGVLRDQRGNDVYLADIFGQGSAYWYALGLLLDEAGDDRYEAHQYAQGAGVHIAVGAAIDWAGADHRASKGVSQGCGHDLGFGLLHDRAGDDNYLGTDKVQGSGSANGLGVLHDGGGDDVYTSLNPEMALGDADMRRDRGSFGFFLDGGGTDRYSRRADGEAWRVFNGKTKGNGYGLDQGEALPTTLPPGGAIGSPGPLPEAATRSRGAEKPSRATSGLIDAGAPAAQSEIPSGPVASGPVFTYAPPALSGTDTLFIVAATGEPRFKGVRDSSENLLRLGGGATLDYLVANRLTGQTPRQRHYVERLFTVISDSGRRREPVERLQAALGNAPDSVKVQLLRIGSALEDTAFLPVARAWLKADNADVRKMAVRSLGVHPDAADRPFLMEGLDKLDAPERQMRLWALAQHPPLKDWRRLLPFLKDEKQYNRQLVRQIVVKASGSIPGKPDAEERLEWALLALEMPGPASKAYLTRMLPQLDANQRRFFQSTRPTAAKPDGTRPKARSAPSKSR